MKKTTRKCDYTKCCNTKCGTIFFVSWIIVGLIFNFIRVNESQSLDTEFSQILTYHGFVSGYGESSFDDINCNDDEPELSCPSLEIYYDILNGTYEWTSPIACMYTYPNWASSCWQGNTIDEIETNYPIGLKTCDLNYNPISGDLYDQYEYDDLETEVDDTETIQSAFYLNIAVVGTFIISLSILNIMKENTKEFRNKTCYQRFNHLPNLFLLIIFFWMFGICIQTRIREYQVRPIDINIIGYGAEGNDTIECCDEVIVCPTIGMDVNIEPTNTDVMGRSLASCLNDQCRLETIADIKSAYPLEIGFVTYYDRRSNEFISDTRHDEIVLNQHQAMIKLMWYELIWFPLLMLFNIFHHTFNNRKNYSQSIV
jgi:hypothetical protein